MGDATLSGIRPLCLLATLAASAAFSHVPPSASRAAARPGLRPPAGRAWARPALAASAGAGGAPTVAVHPGFAPPAPRPFAVTGDVLTLLSAVLAVCLRLCAGVVVTGWRPRLSLKPPAPGEYSLKLGPLYLSDDSAALQGDLPRPTGRLILYEFDSSPFCRKVRDACSMLDLVVSVRPCPGAGGQRGGASNAFSDEMLATTGKRTVPYLIDEGAGVALFESDRIVAHLYERYGPGRGKVPFSLRGLFALVSAGCAAVVRGMPAAKLQVDARAENARMAPLTLYGFEGSPFAHPVREKLCALGLPHTLVNCARGSAHRAELVARTGRAFQVPFLVDPNTGVELHESIEIRMYLDRQYTTSGYTPLRGGSYTAQAPGAAAAAAGGAVAG